jgi:hypothetical protein
MARAATIVAVLVLAGSAAAAPGDPRKALKAPDEAYARSVLVRRAELPPGRWSVTPTDFTQPNPPCQVAHYNFSALTVNGEAGLTYTSGGGLPARGAVVESDADVFLTAAQAARAFATVTSSGFARCTASGLVAALRAGGASAQLLRTGTVATAFRGSGRRVVGGGFGLVLRVAGSGGASTLEVTAIALRRGRLIATLGIVRPYSSRPWQPLPGLEAKIAARMTKG